MQLVSFSVENYKSFNKRQEVFFSNNSRNVTAFFGLNSSGKTNLFSALEFYCDFILKSTNFRRGKLLSRDFFQYLHEASTRPTSFSAEFKNSNYQYKYNFSLGRDGSVETERLQRKKISIGNYETVFSRNSLINDRFEHLGFSANLLRETRPDSLVLTRAYGVNNKIAREVFGCIEKIMPFSMSRFMGYTAEKVSENPDLKEKVLRFLKMADLYIQDFSVERDEDYDRVIETSNMLLSDAAMDLMRRSSYRVTTKHILRREDGGIIGVKGMSLKEDESNGTNQMFSYAAPIIEALEYGAVLYIDELEVNLHPKECAFIVNLFDAKNGKNKANGQLIINTHELSLMDILGKENVYLLGKDELEATKISRMIGARSNEKNLSKKYSAGLFGAIPRTEL